MKAKEARERVKKANELKAEERKLRQETVLNEQTSHLYTQFCNKIDEAINAGKYSTESAGIKVEIHEGQYPDEVVSDVVNMLRQNDYRVDMSYHNVYKKKSFNISWS